MSILEVIIKSSHSRHYQSHTIRKGVITMMENEVLIETPEEAIETIKFNMPTSGYQMLRESLDMAIIALKEVQQYREIGTVEECREAVEKQRPKEIVCENDSVFSNGFSHYRIGRCPMCDRYYNSNDEVNYCSKCGQAIQWEESEEE